MSSVRGEGWESEPTPAGTAAQPRAKRSRKTHLPTFVIAAILVWGPGTYAFIYFMPRMYFAAAERLMLGHGRPTSTISTSGSFPSSIPINTLYVMPTLISPATRTKFAADANHDTLIATGWLDLSKGPQILHVPDMVGRYYSIEFLDPWGDVSYVGRRTTGTRAGDYLITGPGWRGTIPAGVTQKPSRDNTVWLICRVLVESDSDLATAYALEKQIRLTPLSPWQPAQ